MCGKDTYSAIIRHVVCNYISNPVKYAGLKMYIPTHYRNGQENVTSSQMCNFKTWGTEVEITTMAQISGFDIWVYTSTNQWCHYASDETSPPHEAFYISNSSGCHFDPVLDV